MTVTIAGIAFDRVKYDADADVLYLPGSCSRAGVAPKRTSSLPLIMGVDDTSRRAEGGHS
jgi:hypothetical protein